MTTEELEKKLEKINKKFELIVYKGEPSLLYLVDGRTGNPILYDFTSQKYDEENCLKFIPTKIHDLNKLLDEYYKGGKEILASDSENSVDSTDPEKSVIEPAEIADNHNPFKKYTDKLAEILLEKNTAYGDSFSQSVDGYGLKVIGIRLSDKYNRIKHLVNAGSLKENDESLEDTLLDNAGYSILALKYLKEHEKEYENDRR